MFYTSTIRVDHMCDTQARGPDLARNLIKIGPRDHIKSALGLCYIFYFKLNSDMFIMSRFGCSRFSV